MSDKKVFMKVWELEDGELKELLVGPFLLNNLADALMVPNPKVTENPDE